MNAVLSREEWSRQLAALQTEFGRFLGPLTGSVAKAAVACPDIQDRHEHQSCSHALQISRGVLPKAAAWLDLHIPRLKRELHREILAIKIQANWRGDCCRRTVARALELQRLRKDTAATKIQSRWRGGLTRIKLIVEQKARVAEEECKVAAAVMLQRVWRGKLARRRLAEKFAWVEKREVRTFVLCGLCVIIMCCQREAAFG